MHFLCVVHCSRGDGCSSDGHLCFIATDPGCHFSFTLSRTVPHLFVSNSDVTYCTGYKRFGRVNEMEHHGYVYNTEEKCIYTRLRYGYSKEMLSRGGFQERADCRGRKNVLMECIHSSLQYMGRLTRNRVSKGNTKRSTGIERIRIFSIYLACFILLQSGNV